MRGRFLAVGPHHCTAHGAAGKRNPSTVNRHSALPGPAAPVRGEIAPAHSRVVKCGRREGGGEHTLYLWVAPRGRPSRSRKARKARAVAVGPADESGATRPARAAPLSPATIRPRGGRR